MLARRFTVVCLLAAMFGIFFAQLVQLEARPAPFGPAGPAWACGGETEIRCIALGRQ